MTFGDKELLTASGSDQGDGDILEVSMKSLGNYVQDNPGLLESLGLRKAELTLTWKDISVWVKRQRLTAHWWNAWKFERHKILNNVSGVAKSGSLVALMGPSGAGKTTLLATISKRIKGEMQEGEILLNGRPVEKELLSKISGFVPQLDLVVVTLTAREHLEFMAQMKMDRGVRHSDRRNWVDTLLCELNLNQCSGTRISALSGGEKKRLSLAVELLTDPPILFCDEPTTGLDSFSAVAVVEKLRQLSARGKVVICTIHQPASDVFDYFHELLLLANGRVAYHGDLEDAYYFFSSIGMVCPSDYNPADFYISQLATIPGREYESQLKIDMLCDAFEASPYGSKIANHVAATSMPSLIWPNQIDDEFREHVSVRNPTWPTQLYLLLWRTMVDSARDKSGHLARSGLFLMISLVIAISFSNIHLDQHGVQDIRGLLYLIVSEVFFTSAYSVFNTFPSELPIFIRESSNGLYRPSTYYLSKMASVLPRAFVEPLIFFLIIYWIDGFNAGASGFLVMAIPVILLANSATAYGCMLSASFESPTVASLVAVSVDQISLIMSGLFMNLESLPSGVRWLKYLSQFFYSNEALATLHWSGIDHIDCPNPLLPCYSNGQQVLQDTGFEPKNLGVDLMALALLYVLLNFIGFLNVWRRSKSQPTY